MNVKKTKSSKKIVLKISMSMTADMLNVGMFERMHKAVSNPPIKVVVLDVRTLGNRDRNRGRMVRVIRHTLGRRIPADSDEYPVKGSDDSDLLVFVC